MAPNLRDLPNQERLSRLKLPTIEKRKERGDFIAVYRASKGLEKIDREDIFVLDDSNTKRHEKKIKRTTCKRDKKIVSHIEAWNKLDAEIINARNIYDFKSKLDKSRFGDKTIRA